MDGSSALAMISLDALYNSLLLSLFLGSRACLGRGFSTFGHVFARTFESLLPHTGQSSSPHRFAVAAARSVASGAGLRSRPGNRRGAGALATALDSTGALLGRLAGRCLAPGPLGRCVCGALAFVFLAMLQTIAQECTDALFCSGGAIGRCFFASAGAQNLKLAHVTH